MCSSAFAPVLPFCFKPGWMLGRGDGVVNKDADAWCCTPLQRADVPRADFLISPHFGFLLSSGG